MESQWKEQNEIIINEAKTLLSTTNSSFVIGAGVSRSANIPEWKNLLKKLIPEHREKALDADDYEAITKQLNHSDIRVARYIESAFYSSSKSEMVDKMREILYSDAKESPLVNTICDIISNNKKRVESVITYNYDDLIETGLEKREVGCYPVFKKNRNDIYQFPVYHVHGFIPKNKDLNASEIILCEEDYHKIYAQSFHWSNIEQLHAFNRNTCFFIGLSMNDPNLRRLLEESFRDSDEEQHHFIILPRIPLYQKINIKYDEMKNDTDFSIRESVIHKLGLKIIWYENEDEKHENIVPILKRIADA